MTEPGRWNRAEQLYHDALERNEGDRKAFLESACGGDSALLAEVQSLLGHDGQVEGFMSQPAVEVAARQLAQDPAASRPRAMSLSAGTRLGPYEILSSLGAGGMGEVYRARDPRLGRDVALKVIAGDEAPSPDRLRRFEREARAVAALKHPHILAVYDVGWHAGQPYVVFELLEGETLRGRLSRGPLPVSKAVELAAHVCHALAAAHAQGVVHRDLKPENLFLAREGGVKLLDFGLAKLRQAPDAGSDEQPTATATDQGAWLGTPGYVSPEQLRGAGASARSDVFAVGAVLYEMLTGRRAFGGASRADMLSTILDRDPPPMTMPGGPVPLPLERVVRRCLEKDPEDRFQAARDVAFALEALSAPSATAPTPLAAPERSRRSVAFPMIAAALIAGVAVAAFLAGQKRADKSAPSFHQLSFRRGVNWGARFLPDGQTIVYGASWDGQPIRLFSARADSAESRPLDLPAADVLAVSSRGEMAISLDRDFGSWPEGSAGNLARVPFAGGAPREVLDNVYYADWSPDGKELAITRQVGGRTRLEYPIGHVVYESESRVVSPRVSPTGDAVAFIDDRDVALVDRAGKKRTLARAGFCNSLAWSPRGDEVWYMDMASMPNLLYAVSLGGRRRLLDHYSNVARLEDVARDGRALILLGELSLGMAGAPPGDTRERDLSWLSWGQVAYLSPDGRTLLFTERAAGGTSSVAYLRQTDGATPAVRLGEGMATRLSRDMKWALALRGSNPTEVVLLPTGAGEPRVLKAEGIEVDWAAFHPDGKRVVLPGTEAGRPGRDFVQDIAGGPPRPLTPEGVHTMAFLDDGSVVGRDAENRLFIYPAQGGDPQPVAGPPEEGFPCQSAPDGRSFCVVEKHGLTFTFFTRDIRTGRREVRGKVTPADSAGLLEVHPILAENGKSYVYSYSRLLTHLWVEEGLK